MQPPDSTWYPDTGAIHHMTGSSSNLQNQQPYQGSYQFSLQNVFCLFGPSKDGLYPLSLSSHSSTVPRAFTVMHSPAWHRRLGHSSHPMLSHLVPSLGFKFSNAFCKDCALSKSTKLQLGIHQHFSCPHTPQQNGLVERKHRHIATMIRTLLTTSHTPHNLWVEAALTAVHLINLLPTPNL
ncbi:unnamed protein product [Prunus armeniaca]